MSTMEYISWVVYLLAVNVHKTFTEPRIEVAGEAIIFNLFWGIDLCRLLPKHSVDRETTDVGEAIISSLVPVS